MGIDTRSRAAAAGACAFVAKTQMDESLVQAIRAACLPSARHPC
jgi:hypothetical protein